MGQLHTTTSLGQAAALWTGSLQVTETPTLFAMTCSEEERVASYPVLPQATAISYHQESSTVSLLYLPLEARRKTYVQGIPCMSSIVEQARSRWKQQGIGKKLMLSDSGGYSQRLSTSGLLCLTDKRIAFSLFRPCIQVHHCRYHTSR